MESSRPRDRTCDPCVDRQTLHPWATRAVLMSTQVQPIALGMVQSAPRVAHPLSGCHLSLSPVLVIPPFWAWGVTPRGWITGKMVWNMDPSREGDTDRAPTVSLTGDALLVCKLGVGNHRGRKRPLPLVCPQRLGLVGWRFS